MNFSTRYRRKNVDKKRNTKQEKTVTQEEE